MSDQAVEYTCAGCNPDVDDPDVDWCARCRPEAGMLEALYSILNLEGAARLGGKSPAYEGLDVAWHFDKVKAAIKAYEAR